MPFGPKNVTKVEGLDLGDLVPLPGADGYYITKEGRVFSIRELSIHTDRDGYRRVNAGKLRKGLHQLMAIAFLPKPGPLQDEVRHLDGNPSNNLLGNLAWGTRAENAADMAEHGTAKGEKNANSILTTAQVVFVKTNKSMKNREIAEMLGVSIACIKNIKSGRNWSHVGRDASMEVPA